MNSRDPERRAAERFCSRAAGSHGATCHADRGNYERTGDLRVPRKASSNAFGFAASCGPAIGVALSAPSLLTSILATMPAACIARDSRVTSRILNRDGLLGVTMVFLDVTQDIFKCDNANQNYIFCTILSILPTRKSLKKRLLKPVPKC
jgi:hypothetical protein